MRHAMARLKKLIPNAKAHSFAIAFAGLAFGLPAQVAMAQDASSTHPVVVELFTSQGCSSCPPADALLAEIANRDDILALALHVDYWDYIGWKDDFADPKFTLRQRAYAHAAGHRTVYTPHMVVNGSDHLGGFEPMKLADLIIERKRKLQHSNISLSARRSGDTLAISMASKQRSPSDLRVQVVHFHPLERVAIRFGENRGKTIDYANIVTSWTRVGDWNGRADAKLNVPLASSDPVSVVIQENINGLPGEIVAAVRVQ